MSLQVRLRPENVSKQEPLAIAEAASFTGQMPSLSPNWQHQNTEGIQLSAVNCTMTETATASVSDYVQMDVFTSAKSAQYVEILGQGHKQTSRIPGVTS